MSRSSVRSPSAAVLARPTAGWRRSARRQTERPVQARFKLPSLTGLLVRGLLLAFAVVVLWRLAGLGFDTVEAARFTRPVVTEAAAIVPPPAPVPPPLVTPDGLSNVLQDSIVVGGTVGVYVRNQANGASAGLNADRRFAAASLFKVPVLVEVFKQQRLKQFNWDDELTVGKEHWTDGSGVLQARIGDRLKISQLLYLMIAESDNIAANMLTDLVGVGNINQTMVALGLKSTRVVDRFRENAMPTTSAEDMGRLFELIASGRLVDAATSEEAVRLLESKQAQSWLGDGLPWWGKLAHKWGDLPNARHDAGILFTPHNQIILVVLTEGAGASAAADQIRALSHNILNYVEGPGP